MLEEVPEFRGGKRGGAPKKKEEELKKKRTIRLSDIEYNKLKTKFKNEKNIKITFAEYLRAILMNSNVKYFYIDLSKREIIKELASIGNNINQIAKSLNESNHRENIIEEFQFVTQQLDKIFEAMYGKKDEY